MTKGDDTTPKIDPEGARQGQKTGHMRYVLLVSTMLAVIVLMGLFFVYS